MSVSFSPCGGRIASASSDHTIKVWEASTGTCQSTLRGHDGKDGCICKRDEYGDFAVDPECPVSGHDGMVFSVCFSPDGKKMASSGEDKTVRIWDTATGAAVGSPLTGHRYDPFPCIECLLS
jgi:WD40 repeat protein